MQCKDCKCQFRYTDKKYAVVSYLKSEVLIQYRCVICHKAYKDTLYHRFRTGEDRVPY